ncbi:MAG: hypothetical protein M3023_03425 [Pseudomonadota bacterium]|nr:hypothetical protein [Pseudomonadota bacterium]
MYTNGKSHRFPALVLAAGLTTAVVFGLSALSHSQLGTLSPDSRLDGTISAVSVPDASTEPLRIDVVAHRTEEGIALNHAAQCDHS